MKRRQFLNAPAGAADIAARSNTAMGKNFRAEACSIGATPKCSGVNDIRAFDEALQDRGWIDDPQGVSVRRTRYDLRTRQCISRFCENTIVDRHY
jgi:hypothetical protein